MINNTFSKPQKSRTVFRPEKIINKEYIIYKYNINNPARNVSLLSAILTFLLLLPGAFLHADIPVSERQALIAIYNNTGGETWRNNSGWKSGTLDVDGFSLPGSENSWYGVTVSGGHVTKLTFIRNNLTGTLPSELGDLTGLEAVNISDSPGMDSALPAEIGRLVRLKRLYLHGEFSGSIPIDIGQLTSLETLNLQGYFTDSLPSELGNLTNLEELHLTGDFSGSIPAELGNLIRLHTLALTGNFTGELPSEITRLVNLKEFYLICYVPNDNQPVLSSPAVRQQRFRVMENQLQDWLGLLGGPLPAGFGSLVNLERLIIFAPLNGSIPVEIGSLTNLETLFLWCDFSDAIPQEMGKLKKLKALSLAGNRLSGEIPPDLGQLQSLMHLQLQNNELSGSIPLEIGDLRQLVQLRLDGNRLSGPVPERLTQLVSTYQLNLSYNKLYSNEDSVINFLDKKDLQWKRTQTLPPENVTARSTSPTSIRVHWNSIAYRADSGHYTIFYSQSPGGPWDAAGTTQNKSANYFDVNKLRRNETYYFVIQTRTNPNRYNKNELVSDYSGEATAQTQ